MISPAYQCGCPEHGNQATGVSPSPVNLKSCDSFAETECDDLSSCGCGPGSEEETTEKSRVLSEIATKGLPYKEIEVIINDNRVVVRLQTEKPSEFDPPCECVEPKIVASETKSNYKGGNEVVFQRAKENCRTINVYPHPDPKIVDSSKVDKKFDFKKMVDPPAPVKFPTVNPEENPNIFVLKIKRKCENGEKRHNLDLEFRAPRPWRQQPR